MIQADFKRGMAIGLGGIASLVLVVGVVIFGFLAFTYLNTDFRKEAIVKEVQSACGMVMTTSSNPPADASVFGQLDFYEQRKKDLAGCGAAQLKLTMYDAGIDVDAD